jgi:hypothetical protein
MVVVRAAPSFFGCHGKISLNAAVRGRNGPQVSPIWIPLNFRRVHKHTQTRDHHTDHVGIATNAVRWVQHNVLPRQVGTRV